MSSLDLMTFILQSNSLQTFLLKPLKHYYFLQDFAEQAETIYKRTDRRNDLDKAYVSLVSSMFDQINRIAAESQKTPSSLVMCGRYLIS